MMQNAWPADLKHVLRAGWQAEPDKRPSFREIDAVSCHELDGKYYAPDRGLCSGCCLCFPVEPSTGIRGMATGLKHAAPPLRRFVSVNKNIKFHQRPAVYMVFFLDSLYEVLCLHYTPSSRKNFPTPHVFEVDHGMRFHEYPPPLVR